MTYLDKLTILNQQFLEAVRMRSEKSIIAKYVQAGVQALGADYGYAFIRDFEKRNFKLIYKDKATPFVSKKPRKKGATATAFKAKKPVFYNNIGENEFIRDDAKKFMRSVAVIPITYKRVSYGIIDLCFHDNHVFSEEDKQLCSMIGSNAAQAIRSYHLIQDKNRALEDREKFLALASHELKTPLTSMKSYSQGLVRKLSQTNASKDTADSVQSILKQTDKLIHIVNDILEYSGFKSFNFRLNVKKIEVTGLVAEVVEKFRGVESTRTFICNSSEPMYLMGDRDRIEQVLINLLSNAVKYSDATQNIIIQVLPVGKDVHISVQDFGIGISSELQPIIFDPFVQINRSFPHGLGLGLYISKKIMELHQGNLMVTSTPNEGSTFTISLPRQG